MKEELKTVLDEHFFLTNVQNLGSENGQTHYSAELDNEAFMNYTTEALKMASGEEMPEGSLEDLREVLASLDLDMEIWIDEEMNVPTQVVADLELEVDNGVIEVDIGLEYSNFNEPVEVEIPDDAENFDLISIMTGGQITSDDLKNNEGVEIE